MDYINNNEDNDTESGRIKGSNKDRVISFLYRYRFKLYKRTNYGSIDKIKFANQLKLKNSVVNKVISINELNSQGIKYIEVDPATEEFDFDKYDYYIIRPTRRKGIAPKEPEEKMKSGLSKISSISAKGLAGRIKDSKNLVDDTRKALNSVRINLEYPVLHREDLSKMYHSIRENINDLKYEYEILKSETGNRSYAFEEAIKILDQVDNYSIDNISKMDNMLKVASLELSKLSINSDIKKKQDNIEMTNKELVFNKNSVGVNLYENKLGYNESIDHDQVQKEKFVNEVVNENIDESLKEKEFILENNNSNESLKDENVLSNDQKDIDNEIKKDDVDETIEIKEPVLTIKMPKEDVVNKEKLSKLNINYVSIKSYEEKIAYELKRQKEIIDNMYKKIGKVNKEEIKTYEVTGYGRMLASLGNIALGMVTLPLTKLRIFDMAFGANLINRGVKNLKKGLDYKEVIKVEYKYEDFTNKLNDTQKSLDDIKYLINDSLDDLIELKKQFIKEFSVYEYQIPDYHKTLKNMDILSTRLKDNQKKLDSIDNTLEEEKEKNKTMIKKIENQDY